MGMRFWGLLGLTMLCASPAMAGTTVLLQGEPGDYLIGDRRVVLSSPSASFFIKATATELAISVDSDSDWFQIDFEVPKGRTLSELDSYSGATGFNSPTQPGMSVSGNGVGCLDNRSSFTIREAAFGEGGEVLRLAIDLLQYCSNATGAVFGAVRINSDIPLEDPDPHAVASAPGTVFGGENVTLDAAQSYQLPSSSNLTYRWVQVAGPAVTLTGANAEKATFVAPYVQPGGEQLEFELRVSDNAGRHAEDRVSVQVLSKSGAQTALFFRSEPGDYIGQGKTTRHLPTDGRMEVTKSSAGGFQIFFEQARPFLLFFEPPQGQELQAGTYAGAESLGGRDPSRPGLDVAGDGRGCNEVTGQFVVRHIQWNASGEPAAFAVDFEQHCEGAEAALFGTALFNYAPTTGLPVAKAGADQLAVARRGVALDGSTSTADGSLRHYIWRQLAGTPVVLSGADGSRPTFTAPATAGLLSFQLLVVDDKELTAVDTVDVLVENPSTGGGSGGSGSGGGGGGGAPAPALLLSLAALAWWSRRGNRVRSGRT